MNCEELINYLQQLPKDFRITICDPETERFYLVTEMDVVANEEHKEIVFYAE